MVGVEVEITTEDDEYNGQVREKVKFMNASGSFAKRGVKPMDSNQAKALAAKYNMALKNAQKKGAPAQAKPKKGTVNANDYASPDEDLPF